MSALLDEIADVAATMRGFQRAFFAASPGSPERNKALRMSKAHERKLDELLERRRGASAPSDPPPQGDLFR